MAITRKESSGIEITEARGDEDVFPCSLPLQEGTSRLEEWRSHEGFPNATKAHLLLRAKPTKDNDPFLMVSFSSTPEMASSTTTSQAPRRRSLGPLHNLPRRRLPGHQPSQLGGHPPRVTSSRSLTRTNRGGELNTMQ